MNTQQFALMQAIEREGKRRRCRENYAKYVKHTNADFKELKHSVFLCDIIDGALKKWEAMSRGDMPTENQYIMVSMPPRHGKSMTITETLPGYFMCKYPRSKVILTAYSSTLANDFAKANSRKIEENNIFDVKVTADNQDRMELSNGSVMVKAGILGGLTGKGANLIIIDDPIKTAEEARSEVHREKVWKEWESSISTRQEPPTIFILIMTRWHEDDLAGRLLNHEYGEVLPWKVINLPLEAESNDILGRTVGEPLWPDRYGYDFIRERKQYPESFNALYQGRPTSEEGNMLKREWWQYYTALPPKFDMMLQSWDMTFKDTDGSDFVVGQVWGSYGADVYLIDQVRARMDFPTTVQAVLDMTAKHPKATTKLIEDKANGSAVIAMLRHKVGGIIAITPKESKQARASAVSPLIESHNVYLPHAAFTNEFIEECSAFPRGAHDDMVDAMSQALQRFMYVREHDPSYKLPDDLPEDLKQDLVNDPQALAHWLKEHGRL